MPHNTAEWPQMADAALLIGTTAGPVARVASAAGGGGNASINLTKTIADVTVTPALGLSLSVDRPTAGNEAAAKAFAEETGRFTISMTEGGKWLTGYGDLWKIFTEEGVAKGIWKAISTRFASNTSGDVFAFVEGAKPDSIFKTVEEPILQERGIKINYMPKSPCG
jgi:hypothetical protein